MNALMRSEQEIRKKLQSLCEAHEANKDDFQIFRKLSSWREALEWVLNTRFILKAESEEDTLVK